MLKRFLENRRKKKLIDELHGYISVQVQNSYANTIGDERNHISSEIAILSLALIEVVESENPARLLRVKLYEALKQHSTMQILALTPTEQRDTFYADCTYISAAFSHRLDSVMPKLSNFKDIWFDQKLMLNSNSELLRLCNHTSLTAGIRTNVFNQARAWLDADSVIQSGDWFRKVLLANLIIAESQIRDELGEPSILSEDLIDAGLIRVSIGLLAHDYLINSIDPYNDWKMQLRDGSDFLTDLGLKIGK